MTKPYALPDVVQVDRGTWHSGKMGSKTKTKTRKLEKFLSFGGPKVNPKTRKLERFLSFGGPKVNPKTRKFEQFLSF